MAHDTKLAVVTGASSGIGLEIAKQLVARGYDVVACSDDAAELNRATVGLGAGGTQVQAVVADLATPEGVEELIAAVQTRGTPDVLVLNAGIANGGPFLETSLYGDLRVISLNIASVVHLSKTLLPAMVARGEGRVLLTGSTASVMPGPYYATYAGSKAFVLSFGEAIRNELQDTGVTVTTLLPGPTDTEFFERSDLEETPVGQGPKDDPAQVAEQGIEGMLAGKDKVSAGSVKTRSQTAMAAVMPEKAKAAQHASMTKPLDEDA